MDENGPPGIQLVRGEMREWSDFESILPPPRGEALGALVDSAVGADKRVALIGPHAPELVSRVASQAKEVAVLLRSVADAHAVALHVEGGQVAVIAGALDGLVTAGGPKYDVVIAADGLDRVMGADSPPTDWADRLAALLAVLEPEGSLVLGLDNEFSVGAILDPRASDARYGDFDWLPFHLETERPTSASGLATCLRERGIEANRIYADFPTDGESGLLIDTEILAVSPAGSLAANQAVQATTSALRDVPLLAPAGDLVRRASAAGQLASVAPRWVAVAGFATPAMYRACSRSGSIVVGDLVDSEPATWRLRNLPAPGLGEPGWSSVQWDVPNVESVEEELRRLAASEDVGAFREVALTLGNWARRLPPDSAVSLRWDDIYRTDSGFVEGIKRQARVQSGLPDEWLAAAWLRFHRRLIDGFHRHPWPPWMVGPDLVTTWLRMSGTEAPVEVLVPGSLLASTFGPSEADEAGVDLKTAQLRAKALTAQVGELMGHINGLERTLGYRDSQLRVREGRIRKLRARIVELEADAAERKSHGLRTRVRRLLYK